MGQSRWSHTRQSRRSHLRMRSVGTTAASQKEKRRLHVTRCGQAGKVHRPSSSGSDVLCASGADLSGQQWYGGSSWTSAEPEWKRHRCLGTEVACVSLVVCRRYVAKS